MEYKTVMLEEITVNNVTDKIDEKINEMSNKGYEFIDLSFLGT